MIKRFNCRFTLITEAGAGARVGTWARVGVGAGATGLLIIEGYLDCIHSSSFV